jgi:GTP cyclohydrolase IV
VPERTARQGGQGALGGLSLDAHSAARAPRFSLLAEPGSRGAPELEGIDLREHRLIATRFDSRHEPQLIEELRNLLGRGLNDPDVSLSRIAELFRPVERVREAGNGCQWCPQVVTRERHEPGKAVFWSHEPPWYGCGEGITAAMDDLSRLLDHDLQASQPEVQLGLSRAGVIGASKAIRISYGENEQQIAADIECTVDLDPAQKGVHMSRFPELFEEAIEEVVIGEAFLVEVLAEHIAAHVVERQQALRAEVRIVARYPIERMTPVTGLPTQEMVSLIGIAAASTSGLRRLVGVEAAGINACPCAQGLVRGRASERLLEAGFDDGDVDRIFELVPLATHNQRGRGTLYLGTQASVNAEQLVEIVEGSMSAPVYELLKRPDELFVVEHAHLQPRFVEDSVRLALKGVLDAYPALADDDFVFSRQVNLETIHTHDVLAERFGTVGELRRELERGGPLEHHTELREWLAGA